MRYIFVIFLTFNIYTNEFFNVLKDKYVDFYKTFLTIEKYLKDAKIKQISNISVDFANILQKLNIHYEKYNFKNLKKEDFNKLRIPKTIHQIWLGSPFPEKYKKWQESWKKFHPGWKYKLWTDKDVKKLKLINQKEYNEAKNYGEKSDILRYEILYKFGGLYVDIDFECFKPFDALHYCCNFYAGIFNRRGIINNALIGSHPGNEILKTCVNDLKYFAHKKNTLLKTGPWFFRDCILKCIKKNKADKAYILPTTYFYAYPDKFYHKRIQEFIKPETFALHYWAGSWIAKKKKALG